MASVTGTDASETIDRADGVTDNSDTILGLGGNDTIFGLGGADYIKGGGGADTINGGGGIDTASYADSGESVIVSLGAGLGMGGTAEGDELISIENLEGSSHNDFLQGNASANVLTGLGGNDIFKGGGGADTLNGGSGIDTASYADSGEGVSVNLRLGTGNNGTAEGDELISIENLIGSDHGDFLIGDDSDNLIQGGDGNDFLLRGGAGADTIDGGSGIDEVNYLDSDASVNVNLLLGEGTGGTAEGDVLINIEDLQGSQFGDVLRGNASANLIDGNSGDDALYGGGGADNLDGDGGADHIEGGAGADRLTGGAGADIFRWLSTADAGTTFNTADLLSDFDRSEGDLLDFSAIDADVTASGNQSFDFIGREAFTEPGQVRWFAQGDRTFIVLNTDTDGLREMIVEVEGLPTVEADWFIL
jgi:serralysin